MSRTRRLAVLLAGIVAATGIAVLPAADAAEPTVDVPARNNIGCIWVDALHWSLCLWD